MDGVPNGFDPDDPDGVIDPDDLPEDSPYEWLDAEWLPDTWVHPEALSPTRDVDRFRRSSAGAIIAGGLLGLERVLQVEREDPPIVREQGGEPPKRKWQLDLDPDDPTNSSITRRNGH